MTHPPARHGRRRRRRDDQTMWLAQLPGIYLPQADTWLLAEALDQAGIPPGGAVLDIGCGSGALSILAARTRPATVTAVDVSRRAVLATRINTRVRGLPVRVERGDALDRVTGRVFDLVLANPPYVPGPPEVPRRGRNRAWDAGVDGRSILDRLCAKVPSMLRLGGTLLIVHSALCDVDMTLRLLRDGGLKAAVVARAEEPFGPVLRGRVDLLHARGLLQPGQRTEELVVIRGDKPAPRA